MGAKKGSKKKKAKGRPEREPEDEFTEMTMEELHAKIEEYKQKQNDVRVRRNYIQNEKDMIFSFSENTRKEVEDIEAQIKLKDTEMEHRENEHRTEVKVYMQKVQHLEYDMKIDSNEVMDKGEEMTKKETEQHEKREDDNKLSKVQRKKEIRSK